MEKGNMFPYFLAVLVAILPALPMWMRSVLRRSKDSPSNVEVGVLIGFYISLAISVFLSFFLAWYTYSVTVLYLAPFVTGVIMEPGLLDEALTGRVLAFFSLVVGIPSFVFFKVGVLAVRDAHQVCKEQLDRVRKHHKLGPLWRGI